MAQDILNRRLAQYGGSFSLDDTLLTFPGLLNAAAFLPYIIRQLGINYGQPVTRFYGLNQAKVFLVAGRAAGQATIQQVLAPQGNLGTFFSTFGNVCSAPQNIMQFSIRSGCLTSFTGAQRFIASMCVATQLSINTSADDPSVNNSAQLTFESLEYSQAS